MQSDEGLISRVETLEILLKRAQRRSVKRIVSIVPSVPITVYGAAPDESGVIARFMFPGLGVIKRVCLLFDVADNKTQIATVVLKQGETSVVRTFMVPKRGLVEEIELAVSALDHVTVSAKWGPLWAAFLWQPTMRDGDIKSHLLDAIEPADIDAPPEKSKKKK